MNPLKRFAISLAENFGLRPAEARLDYRGQPAALSPNATVAKLQSALRIAEQGDTRDLFSLYRDLVSGGSHIGAEFGKRKLAVLCETHAILPADKSNADDLKAADAIRQMIDGCENWTVGLTHLLDASLWPVAIAEKIFAPAVPAASDAVPLRFMLSRFAMVDPALLCFKKRFGPVGTQSSASPLSFSPPNGDAVESVPTAAPFEPDLRFYSTNERGTIQYSLETTYPADRARHIVHRGHLLQSLPDCWGGPMRSILFWWLLGILGRDWFARMLERYGAPFIVGRTNSRDKAAVDFLKDAFSSATKLHGIVVDTETQIELKEAAASGSADAYERFLSICNREISKAIIGQELSSTAASTGLGSSVGKLQSDVRDDIRRFDQLMLAETLRRQLFKPFIEMNGLRGAAPRIVWGGLDAADADSFSKMLETLERAGYEPTEEALPTICDRVGFQVKRKAAAAPPALSAVENGGLKMENGAAPVVHPLSAILHPRLRATLAAYSAQSKAATALGVPAAWLAPVRDLLGQIAAKAADQTLTDAEMLDALDKLVAQMPELFSEMDVESLAKLFEAGMGGAVVDGVRQGIKAHAQTHSGSPNAAGAP